MQYILFTAAGLKLAIPASRVKAVHEQLNIQDVAGTVSWFLGLGVANGRILPVTDFGAFAGRTSCSGRVLELAPEVAIAALQVDEVPGFSDAQPVDVPASEKPVDMQGENLYLMGKSLSSKVGEHLMFDIDALVQSSAFNNIKGRIS